ncbi:MAG: TadE/TadG family type IV pilus assembly protein [Terracidiphilus sp.]
MSVEQKPARKLDKVPSPVAAFFGTVRPRFVRSRRIAAMVAAMVRDDEGQSLVEFAISSTVLLTFIFCMAEATLAYYSYDMISESAREGTRYAMVRGSSCTTSGNSSCEVTASQVNSYVADLGWPNLGGGTVTVNTTYPDGNENPQTSRVKVSIQYVFPINLPFVPSHSITMNASSEAYIIQ